MPEPAKPPWRTPAESDLMAAMAKRKGIIIAAAILLVALFVGFGTYNLGATAMATASQSQLDACGENLSLAVASLANCTSHSSELESSLASCNSLLGTCRSDLQSCISQRDSYLSQLGACSVNLTEARSALRSSQANYDALAGGYARLRCCQLKVLTGLNYNQYFVQNNNVECCYAQGDNATLVCTAAHTSQPLVAVSCA